MKLQHLILASALTAGLAACSDSGTAVATTGERSSFELANDHAVGSADAPVTVVEYASVTCSHCANWSNTVYPAFKEKYVDTGKVRYVFREFPTPPEALADAGFMIANCADDKRAGAFMDNVKLQFERQADILRTAQLAPDQLRDQYVYLAKEGGLSEEEMEACLADQTVREDYITKVQSGLDAGITGTPAFLVNGEKVKAFTLEDFDDAIANATGGTAPEG